ncbi:Uncharacterized protein YwgA [Armatimonadetes bacterium GBS]|jgi:uncharacterized protein YwgA|nr:MAG: hypothetical protein KatS3mg021_2115 [Fimbriimonadales bacterium]CUU11017.1 Uncharacterized protein YwgA [Armatimonadetes bacterium GBS]CUU34159.1 Uncharacterized protein YwgA [Armatimonadetes bacterium GXS]
MVNLSLSERIAILTEIVRHLGKVRRTALMKVVYLLQTVKGVPFGYDFRLYLYGPYTPSVLSDIDMAVYWKALKEEYFSTERIAGYEIGPGEDANSFIQKHQAVVERHKEAVRWVIERFGEYNSSAMETIATIVWVDRELANGGVGTRQEEIFRRVAEIKPHFPHEEIRKLMVRLQEMGILKNVQPLHTL